MTSSSEGGTRASTALMASGLSLDDEQVHNPLSDYIRLISSDGHCFLVSRACAMCSGTLRAMLSTPGQWAENTGAVPTVRLESIPSHVLEKVCQYMYYKKRYDGTLPPLPPFKLELANIEQLLLAASFLDS